MDFSALKQADGRLAVQASSREQESEKHYQQALDAIAAYNQSQDTRHIRIALESLTRSVEKQRSNARAYYLMAYLYYAIQSPKLAVKYLRLAESIDPTLPEIARLKDCLQGAEQVATVAASVTGGARASDDEESYDALEAELTRLHLACVRDAGWVPVPEPAAIERMRRLTSDYQAGREQFRRQMRALEAEYDCSPLQHRYHLFEFALGTLERSLDCAVSQLRLREQMLGLEKHLLGLNSQQAEAELESLLDACDRYADQLDAWDAKGYPIDGVKPDYKRLILAVEALQDQFES